MDLGGSWAPFGQGVGWSGTSCKMFFAVLGVFQTKLFSSIGPRWGPKNILDRFWLDFGRFWANLGRVWGRFVKVLEGFGILCTGSGQILILVENDWHDLVLLGQNF